MSSDILFDEPSPPLNTSDSKSNMGSTLPSRKRKRIVEDDAPTPSVSDESSGQLGSPSPHVQSMEEDEENEHDYNFRSTHQRKARNYIPESDLTCSMPSQKRARLEKLAATIRDKHGIAPTPPFVLSAQQEPSKEKPLASNTQSTDASAPRNSLDDFIVSEDEMSTQTPASASPRFSDSEQDIMKVIESMPVYEEPKAFEIYIQYLCEAYMDPSKESTVRTVPDPYFSPAIKRIEDRLSFCYEDMLGNSKWTPKYRADLQNYPDMHGSHITEAKYCTACSHAIHATNKVVLSGCKYNDGVLWKHAVCAVWNNNCLTML